MFKIKNGLVSHYISEIFHTVPKGYNLRNADFNIPRFRHCVYFGPLLEGKFSPSDRKKSSLDSFKQRINKNDFPLLIDEPENCDICYGLESEISMEKWKNNGFDMKFISSCQIQAEISSNRHTGR